MEIGPDNPELPNHKKIGDVKAIWFHKRQEDPQASFLYALPSILANYFMGNSIWTAFVLCLRVCLPSLVSCDGMKLQLWRVAFQEPFGF
jgi:hypothetical protein